jgi:radical SAM protein with 4Fe4S-binding SPASM domain
MNRAVFVASGLINAPRNLIYRALNKPLKPRMIWLNVTDRCNSKCAHCSIWKQKPTENPLSPDEIYNMLKSPVFSKLQSIVNTGGECTLRDDLAQIIIAEHQALPKAKLIISTNGLKPERVVSLVQYLNGIGIIIEVGISLDGVDGAHDKIRGVPGNFALVDLLLNSLNGTKVNVPFVLSDLTIDNLQPVQKYLENLDKDIVFNVLQCNDANYYHSEVQPNNQRERMIKAVESLDSGVVGGYLIKRAWLRWLQGKPIKFPCFALQTTCAIKCNGDIVPCLSRWDSSIGNIREETPEEIWNGRLAYLYRSRIKKCPGCLNFCSVGDSYYSAFYPYMEYLKNPKEIFRG